MPKGRIRAGAVPRPAGKIQSPPPPAGEIVFSFRHLDWSTPEFSIDGCPPEWFRTLFNRFRDISTMRPQELFSSQSKALRAHSLDWSRTAKPDGFAHLNEQFRAIEAYQFQLSKQKGRVHGFFVDVTFHVVWLDPDHNLYD